MTKEQDAKLLEKYFGRFYPTNAEQARITLDKDGESLPLAVYRALSDLVCEGMGKTTSPKKKDRQRGQRLRKNRTGSRRG